jgi:type I restriction enzyme S subunit
MISDLGNIPLGWKKSRFGDIAENVVDRINSPKESGLKEYIGLEHLDTDEIRVKRFGSTDDVEATKFLCRRGDIIFGKRNAYLRKVAVTDRDAVVSAHSMVLRPKGDKIVPEFLSCLMQSSQFWKTAQAISEGSMSPTIKWKTLYVQEFWLPSIDEQRRIAEILWTIESDLERTEHLIQVTEKLKKGLLEELLTKGIGHGKFKKTELGEIPEEWEIRTLGEITLSREGIKRGPWGSSIKKSFFVKDGYKVYEQQNVLAKDFNLGNYFINDAKFKELKGFEVNSGDFLITGAGTVGQIARVPSGIRNGVFNQALLRIRLNESILPNYFEYLFSYLFEKELLSGFSQGAVQKNFSSVKDLSRISFPLPDLNEQGRIIRKIDELEIWLSRTRDNNNIVKEIKKKLTNSLLSGELLIQKEDAN